jgi:flagellar biosynthesis/type III secretory pathway chaperone
MKPITTAAEADAAIDEMTGLVEQLRGVVEQETALVRAGKLRAAAALEPSKSALAGRLYAGSERLKANAKFLQRTAPARCAALAGQQETLRAALQKNMVVLATAHAVSEGIVRRLSGDLARKSSPQVYCASGRTTAPSSKQGKPLALSRVL